MTVAWRISKERYANPPAAAFDGEGSKRRGGRWSVPGQRVAYASCSLSLAALEYFVNLGPQDAPADLVAIQVAIPAGVPVEKVDISSLPAAWRAYPYPAKLHEITARWINSGSSAGLLVPSAVIPSENNLLILPEHPDFRLLTFGEPERFSFDPRMWK